nr:MAG TPA: hypothetical protein [Caudoviricetes sp.]
MLRRCDYIYLLHMVSARMGTAVLTEEKNALDDIFSRILLELIGEEKQ